MTQFVDKTALMNPQWARWLDMLKAQSPDGEIRMRGEFGRQPMPELNQAADGIQPDPFGGLTGPTTPIQRPSLQAMQPAKRDLYRVR